MVISCEAPMMSLKPRNVDFQETWAKLKETVQAVVSLRPVERPVWNARFSDVYALCVAHPDPLADRLYDETKNFLEEHVRALLETVKGNTPLDSHDPEDGFIERYVAAWNEYSQGVAYLNCLYTYLNLQHVKRQKVSDAEIIYGSAASVSCPEQELRQLEVGELGLDIWERVLLGCVGTALSQRIVGALSAARARSTPASPGPVAAAVASTVSVRAFRVRSPLALYQRLVLEPYLAAAGAAHASLAARLLLASDVPQYMRQVLAGLERETALARVFLHPSSVEAARSCYERAAVAAHLPTLHKEVPRLVRAAAAEGPGGAARGDLRRMYLLLRPLGANALRPLLDATQLAAREDGRAALEGGAGSAGGGERDEAHVQFVGGMLALHARYSALLDEVTGGAQSFIGALDKACSAVVNARAEGEAVARAPELLARYCDTLLRKKGSTEGDIDEKLSAAIVVFKYVDDKDVFQKFYARALARRLIHQLCASMEQEEAMINKLKAACGYEFTNKLHRMFTDIAVSADLNAKFQRELRQQAEGGGSSGTSGTNGGGIAGEAGFSVQVLQAGAWPLGGAMAPVAPPPAIEKWARLFETFYRSAFSGRRLAWLHHLCTGELRTKYTTRVYHLTCSVAQAAILLQFDSKDSVAQSDLMSQAVLSDEAFSRQLKPLLDAGLLKQNGDNVVIDLNFTCRRTRVRLALASGGGGGGAGKEMKDVPLSGSSGKEGKEVPCDEDRKMYLQAAIVRVCKQRKVVRHADLVAEVAAMARHSFAPTTIAIKKCIEALIDKQYLERTPHAIDTYSYLA